MPRPMSPESRVVLLLLEESPQTIDQIAARCGMDRARLAFRLRDLRKLGWVTVAGLIRKRRWHVRIYGLARRVPVAAREVPRKSISPPAQVADLLAAFRIGTPVVVPKGRRVRGIR